MKFDVLNLTWKSLGKGKRARRKAIKLYRILSSWEGTPYLNGQQVKEGGADCLQFVVAVCQELLDFPIQKVSSLSGDACIHNRQKTQEALKAIRRLFPESRKIKSDIGTEKNTLWHSTERTGVCKTGFALPSKYQKVFGIYRMKRRSQWLSN
jgi:hypothetical protein